MRRLTGLLIFSFLFLLPLEAKERKVEACPAGTYNCPICGCLSDGTACAQSSCSKAIPLPNKENTIPLEEGALVTCKGKMTLVPSPSGTEGPTYRCGSGEEKAPGK